MDTGCISDLGINFQHKNYVMCYVQSLQPGMYVYEPLTDICDVCYVFTRQ